MDKVVKRKLVQLIRQCWAYYDLNRKLAKKESAVKQVNPETNRLKTYYRCVNCRDVFEKVQVDHIEPVGKEPETFLDFGNWINKLFCEKDNLRILCKTCHSEFTKLQRRLNK